MIRKLLSLFSKIVLLLIGHKDSDKQLNLDDLMREKTQLFDKRNAILEEKERLTNIQQQLIAEGKAAATPSKMTMISFHIEDNNDKIATLDRKFILITNQYNTISEMYHLAQADEEINNTFLSGKSSPLSSEELSELAGKMGDNAQIHFSRISDVNKTFSAAYSNYADLVKEKQVMASNKNIFEQIANNHTTPDSILNTTPCENKQQNTEVNISAEEKSSSSQIYDNDQTIKTAQKPQTKTAVFYEKTPQLIED